MMRIAVAGGTGWIGRMVVSAAREAGHETAVLARSTGVDLISGKGVAEALRGADVVVDVANLNSNSGAKAASFFETETRTLLDAEVAAGVAHHVALSIVGIDHVDIGYYKAKRRQEEVIRAGSVPSTILRATQFFEFAPQMIGHSVGPFAPAPRMLCRPVAASEVAAELLRIVAGPPQGRATDIAGPQELWMHQMIRQFIKARGLRRVAVPIPFPGKASLLPDGEAVFGRIRYADWLSSAALSA
jgi:uncharacterized protein YbjT (DUF2867 family)